MDEASLQTRCSLVIGVFLYCGSLEWAASDSGIQVNQEGWKIEARGHMHSVEFMTEFCLFSSFLNFYIKVFYLPTIHGKLSNYR